MFPPLPLSGENNLTILTTVKCWELSSWYLSYPQGFPYFQNVIYYWDPSVRRHRLSPLSLSSFVGRGVTWSSTDRVRDQEGRSEDCVTSFQTEELRHTIPLSGCVFLLATMGAVSQRSSSSRWKGPQSWECLWAPSTAPQWAGGWTGNKKTLPFLIDPGSSSCRWSMGQSSSEILV